MISDFAADLRAPTPSAAMEMILPDKNEFAMLLDDLGSTILSRTQQLVRKAVVAFGHANEMLNAKSPKNQVVLKIQEAKMLHQRLNQAYETKLAISRGEVDMTAQNLRFELKNILTKKSNELVAISNRLEQLNPQNSSTSHFRC